MRMLKNTLILPVDDPDLAAQQLGAAIGDLHVVLMLVFGKGAEIEQIIDWADQLADKGDFGLGNLRRVVWIREREAGPVGETIRGIKGAETIDEDTVVAVLNFHDVIKVTLRQGDVIDPIELEIAFAAGGQP